MGIVNSFIYKPPFTHPADIARLTGFIKYKDTLCYLEREFEISNEDEVPKPTLHINILHCHGNAVDIVKSDKAFLPLIESFVESSNYKRGLQNFTPDYNIHLKIAHWEYPTYSVNKNTDLDKCSMMIEATHIADLIFKDEPDTINICIGFSIGTAFASQISMMPVVDLVYLVCPFATIPYSVGMPEFFVGKIFDNLESLALATDTVYIHCRMSEADDVMIYSKCEEILHHVDGSSVIPKKKNFLHKDFYSKNSMSNIGGELLELLHDLKKFKRWIAKIEQQSQSCLDDKKHSKELQDSETDKTSQ